MAEQEAIGLLEQLARDFNVRDPRKLFQIARREFPDRRDLTSARAAAALRGDVARQVLAPKPRSLGKSAAEGPNDRLQADLVDFSQNTRGRNKYGLVVQDVFTREIATKALSDKRAETVTRAAAEIIPDLVQEEGNYVVTTDLGNEFQGLEAALPGEAVHRQKDPTDRNATAVVDRAIQTLKKDLAGMVARRGGGWSEHVDEAAEAHNARPHQAVTVAPEDVETMPTATFRVYEDNATKFQHNKKLTEGRKRRLEEAGAFRAPTNARRSFEPQYGPARKIASIDSMVVRATDGTETLLKHALPVPRGSAEPKAKLTRPPALLDQWSLQWTWRGRQRAIGAGAYERYCTLGLCAFGGNAPNVSKASSMKEACVAVNRFVRHRFPHGTWTSIAVLLNPRIGLQRDMQKNMVGKLNHAITLGTLWR